MSNRIGFLKACVVGAVLGGTALISTDAFAQCCQGGGPTAANAFTDGLATSASWPADPWLWPADNASPLKAPPVAPFWWTHGEIEVGGRDFLNDPTVGGSIWGDTNHANFATGGYAFVGPAKFGEVLRVQHRGAGRVRRRPCRHRHQRRSLPNRFVGQQYRLLLSGFSDQSYMLTASKAGEQYLTFIWDQTPHVYSTSAQTIFNGVGSNNLTVPAGLIANPVSSTQRQSECRRRRTAASFPTCIAIDVGIQRNTAAVSYRATDPWMSLGCRSGLFVYDADRHAARRHR